MSNFPHYRPRRLRKTAALRTMVRENNLQVTDLMFPLFVVPGENIKNEITPLPNNYHYSVDNIVEAAREVYELGIPSIILFGLPSYKDEIASSAWDENSPVQKAIRIIKKMVPKLIIATDVCLCQYTSHGHCGVLENGEVLNDPSLEIIAKVAVSHAKAGADMVAPSDMMDGRIAAIRNALDTEGFSNIPIMAYSAKYASAYYGPFRAAADSAPQEGDRKSYQMDPANSLEAMREVEQDIQEGADIVMVKPGLPYLDIVRMVKDNFNRPIAIYNVSGEYAMVKAAAERGWIDEKSVVLETLLSMKRAGASIIITYHAIDAAQWLSTYK